MKKKLLNVILSIAISLTMISATSINVFADGHSSHDGVDSWREISTTLPIESGNYYLTNDITLSGTWNVPTGTTNLCLNGHVINANGGSFSAIMVGSGATLNLYDCNSTTSHDGYVDTNSLWHLGTGAGDAKSITGGIITGSSNGGGLNVSGSFNMYGGTIAGNVNSHGGGIYNSSSGQVKIINGTIENNNTTAAGAGIHTDGILKMTGGTIQNNKASGDGGGISINATSAEVSLTGTTKIVNNNANGNGGGINYYYSSYATEKLSLGNKVQIVDNSANNGTSHNNLYLFSPNMKIKLDAPANGMKVYISDVDTPTTSAPVQFTANGTANDVNYFFSDNTNYGITFNGDHLELIDPQVAYNSTQRVSYDTLTKAITEAESGDVIELWKDNNAENITLPVGVILYTKSNYTGTVTTDISGKAIVKQDITGNFQYIYSVVDEFTITYKDQGNQDFSGIHETGYPSTFLAEVPTELKSATKDGYTFGGWFDNEDCNGNPITVLYNTYTSDLTLYAKWIVNAPPKPKPEPEPEPESESEPEPKTEYKIPNTGVEDVSTNNHSIYKLSVLSILIVGAYLVIKKKKDNH